MNRALKIIGLLLCFMLVGGFSGRLCGFIILFIGDYTGNSGTTGTEYFGYYNLGFEWWWAGWTGQPIGVICGPVAGLLAIASQTHLLKAWLLTIVSTLIGGCIGAFVGPWGGLFMGCGGFVAGCLMITALHPVKSAS